MDNRRQTVVINKEFQHHYALMAVALVVLCTNLFIIARVLLPIDPPLELTVGTASIVAVFELMVIAVVWRASILSSHRIAGPVYVFTRQIKAVGAGDLTARIRLRDKDRFKVEAAEMNAALDDLQAKLEGIKALTSELQGVQASGGDASAHVDKLVEELATLQTKREG
jgi:methyl-accepting chemotaxis protein